MFFLVFLVFFIKFYDSLRSITRKGGRMSRIVLLSRIRELENGRKKTQKTRKNTQTSWVENRREPKYVFAKSGFRRGGTTRGF